MSGRVASGGKRRLCVVGRGGRCFACGGQKETGQGPQGQDGRPVAGRDCPVCGGRGRAMVVDSGDGRTGLPGGPS